MKRINPTYYFKNQYTLGSYLIFEGKIPIIISSRTVTFQMFSRFDQLLDTNSFVVNAEHPESMSLLMHHDHRIKADGYSLDIQTTRKIIIRANNQRGVRYAIAALNQLVKKEGSKFQIPIILIEDEPSFLYRGIIEGYYGEPWTTQERMEMFDFLDHNRLNTYMYAPKFDPYHREKWYELYPAQKISSLETLVSLAFEKDIIFYYCISPGYAKKPEEGFRYAEESEFERLFRKLDQLIHLGVKHFGLLLDDIDYRLSDENRKAFSRPGIAHSYICNKVNQYLKQKAVGGTLVMCPTEYHQIGASEYRTDLNRNLDSDIRVFWTGDNVCSEVITTNDIARTKEAFGKELFIWDNFPVSDFTYGVREFIAPLENRTVDLPRYATGYMINPSIHYHISKIAMITMAHYAWNSSKYDSSKSFEIALKSVGEDFFKEGMDFIQYNYPSIFSYGNLSREKEMVDQKQYDGIISYYQKIAESAKQLLNMNYPIIDELRPWLARAIKEQEISVRIIEQVITKDELTRFLEDIKFSGGELLDYLIYDKKLLNEEEYQTLILKRRGPKWYRVFEYKRWPR